jgi:hypothetical protein
MNVFLTGASSGIGEALAHYYAARGATLGLFARREAGLSRVAAALAPAHVVTYAGDVRDWPVVARSGADFIARFGVPDIVIANAGVSRGTLTEFAEDMPAFAEILAINVLGMVHTFQPFVAAMRAVRHGTLAGIASVGGFRGLPGSAYSASKAAAIAYLESLRVEMFGSGVTVVTVCPGYIATPMTAGNPYPMPFLMQPAAAARSIARAIERRKRFYVMPWPMAVVGRALRCLPRPLFDLGFAHAKVKPRRPD